MTDSKQVKIGDFLKRIKRPIRLEENEEYMLVTVKMHHKGVVLREKKLGKNIGSNMYQVREGDFILSGIDARNGAFGIVPNELDGAIVTNDFWYFEIDDDVIDKHFFLELTSTAWFDDICKKGSDGTTQRIRLQKDKFYNQEISLPSIDNQKPFIKKFLNIKSLKSELNAEISSQTEFLSKLRQSILHEAIEGKLTEQWRQENPDVEPALKLLDKIRAEKDRLIKEKKIKKEKPLPNINEDEVQFDVPDNWEWVRLAECSINRDGDRIPVSQAERERKQKIYDYYGASGVIDKIDGFTHNGDFLLIGEDGANLVARSTPVAFKASGKFWVNNHAHVIEFLDSETLNYMNIYINAIDLKPYITGGFQPKLSQGNLNQIPISFPPFEEQRAIEQRVSYLFDICDELEQQINDSKSNAERLMQAVLKEAFEEKPKTDTTEPHAPKTFQRSVLAAYLIDNSQDDQFFGHVKLQKMLFMCEAVNNLDFDTDYKRHAMGPYDPKLIRPVDSQLKKAKWFEVKKLEGEISRYVYHPLEKAEEYKKYVGRYWDHQKIEHIFHLMKPMKTLQAEIVATLYSANTDLKKANVSITDAILINEARNNWHDNKKNIAVETWEKAIEWMKSKNLL